MTDTALLTKESATHIRRLLPGSIRLFKDDQAVLNCEVRGEATYPSVFAVLLFPVSEPRRFVSIRRNDEEGKVREIGVIEDLSEFDAETRAFVLECLAKHYHQKTIRRVYNLRCEYGWLLSFDVETDQGKEAFQMRWRHDRAESYGEDGKVLLDVFENRYIIPKVSDLPPKDRRRLRSYIYW